MTITLTYEDMEILAAALAVHKVQSSNANLPPRLQRVIFTGTLAVDSDGTGDGKELKEGK